MDRGKTSSYAIQFIDKDIFSLALWISKWIQTPPGITQVKVRSQTIVQDWTKLGTLIYTLSGQGIDEREKQNNN
jgi:hypothetical protein